MYDKLYFHMDGPKTVKYKFSPKYIYGGFGYEYGYICGGQNSSIIDRFSFAFDQGNTVQVGQLSDVRNETSANNSSTHGYICGGRNIIVNTRILDRIFFPLDSGNALDFSAITVQKYATSSFNSQCYGYICGGHTTTFVNTVERFNFSLTSAECVIHSILTDPRYFCASCNSSASGYTCGGIASLLYSTIDKCNFSFDANPHTAVGQLQEQKSYIGSNNSSQYGYICGGQTNNIQRINFSLDSGISNNIGTLENHREYVSCNNSTQYGYICGGTNTNIINRLLFPFDTGIAVSHSQLTTSARTKSSAVDGVDFVKFFEPIDTGPGPSTCDNFLYDSSTDTGYYGFVDSNLLINGTDLSNFLNITSGTLFNDNIGWLKFYSHGKILFIAKRPLRYNISWSQIYNAGAVYGLDGFGPYTSGTNVNQNRILTIGDYSYRIRLMTGAHINPYTRGDNCSDNGGENSEWNELIYRVHDIIPNCGLDGLSVTYHGGNQIGQNWFNFNDLDLGVGNTVNGRRTWTQETSFNLSAGRCRRGQGSIAGFSLTDRESATAFDGWRPVLELII